MVRVLHWMLAVVCRSGTAAMKISDLTELVADIAYFLALVRTSNQIHSRTTALLPAAALDELLAWPEHRLPARLPISYLTIRSRLLSRSGIAPTVRAHPAKIVREYPDSARLSIRRKSCSARAK